ncbi:pyridoxamine kinase [Clostridium sp. E02]|uniref:pyridoxamine kinase n=1 Tax=Clostridium sp. E02 TaxID=2487134 RepID=UPI000F5413E0|nr:pyridoxamine kinase [Clostridium sp. E02]
MKRIVTIQDISCLGKCSLTVALPIISAMGVETAVIPTAVLSTHTMFQDFTYRDLTDEITPISQHWIKEGFQFDGIYTGYFGSVEQIGIVKQFFNQFRTDENLIFVDPVMADNGKLYPSFDLNFVQEMAGLCASADIIVPNLTEACLMTGTEYRTDYDEAYVKELLGRLKALGTRKAVVLTGVSLNSGKTGVAGIFTESGDYFSYCHEKVDTNYHGTGDIFSSATVGALMNGKNLMDSLKIAANYTVECIKATQIDGKKTWYGVNFETVIPKLIHALGK